MIKRLYRLWADKSIEGVDCDELWDVDEDYTTKKDYIKAAKAYTDGFNKRHSTTYTYQEIFGEPEEIGYRLCTDCGETFWVDDEEHECK